jgi:acetoin:2,6-dichlorophenolindophenol oxidoreductase subunit alpha
MVTSAAEVDTETALDLLRRMLRIRRFEEKIAALKAAAELPGFVHLYIGEEAVASGVCSALEPSDYITSTHRGHGHIVAKGGDLGRCMAELYGRSDGYCKGKGGSMHIADIEAGIIGANGIVGAGIPLATGAALAAKMRGTKQVSVAFFGDGASNQGTFHEGLNLAAIWSLPVIFVCENNGYTELTPMRELVALGAVHQRAEGYGIPHVQVDGNDAVAVREAALEAVERARAGGGPSLIEAITYRIHNHSEGLEAIVGQTRSLEEVQEWGTRDPIARHLDRLEQLGLAAADLQRIDDEIRDDVERAVEFGRQSPEPDVAEAYTDRWVLEPAAGDLEED